jgi:hypothetical protein
MSYEDYGVPKGKVLLILADAHRLENGTICCSSYEAATWGKQVPTWVLKRTIFISIGKKEFVNLLVGPERRPVTIPKYKIEDASAEELSEAVA